MKDRVGGGFKGGHRRDTHRRGVGVSEEEDWRKDHPKQTVTNSSEVPKEQESSRRSGGGSRRQQHPHHSTKQPIAAVSTPRKISTESIVIGPTSGDTSGTTAGGATSGGGASNRIANVNLSLPRIPEKLSPDSQAILDNLVEKYPFIVGSTWVPMLDVTNETSALSHSFIGGTKILCRGSQHTEWPMCLNCRSPMPVLAQIDRSTLPHTLHGKGVVQLFACIRCATAGAGAIPRRSVCWANSVPDLTGWIPRECPDSKATSVPFRRIVKWLPRTDYMHPLDVETETGIRLPIEEWAVLGEAQIRCDKVGGYPAWLINGPPKKFPTCKMCDRKMRLLLLIDSMDNVPVEWGIDGCMQVFECPNHPESLFASWEHMSTGR